jgi:integral membrane protein
MPASQDDRDQLRQLSRMRVASLVEGITLTLLVFVAVPVKHLGGYPAFTMVMGPIHGMAFVIYGWMLMRTVAGGSIPRRGVVRMVAAAFIPFGAFFTERELRRLQAARITTV